MIFHERSPAPGPVNLDIGERVGLGRTAEVFAAGTGGVAKVLRPGMPEALAAREAEVARVVTNARVPAPAFLGAGVVDGRPAIFYERISGPSMLDLMSRRPLSLDALARQFADLHLAMHDARGDGLPEQRVSLRAAMAHAGERLTAEARAAVQSRLDALPDGAVICHGDMHPGNVVMAAVGPIVIDWMTATCGRAEADVARTLLLLRESAVPEYLPAWQRSLLAVARRRFAATYLRRYRERRPLDEAELRAWRLPILAARFADGIAGEDQYLREALADELTRG